MTNVSLTIIKSSSEARGLHLPRFAESFDHKLEPAYPIIIGWINGQIRGYAQLERRWLVTPAIHPGLNSPRDTYALAKATIEALRQTSPGFLVQAPLEKATIFTDPIMRKCGLKRWPHRVFFSE